MRTAARTAARTATVTLALTAATAATVLSAGSASAAVVPGVLPVSAGASASTSATGTAGALADVAVRPLRTAAGTVQLCPGTTTSLGVTASAGSLALVRPRLATSSWATSTAGSAAVGLPSVTGAFDAALGSGVAVTAGGSGVTTAVDLPVVTHVVGGTSVRLPRVQLQQALAAVRADVRTAAALVPTVTAAVDAEALGAAVRTSGPLALGLATGSGSCVTVDWQLLG